MKKFTRSFVSSRITELPALPVSWYVKRKKDQQLCEIDLRTCRIVNLSEQVGYFFELSSTNFASSQTLPKKTDDRDDAHSGMTPDNDPLEYPEFILKLDVSLNEIEQLAPQDFEVFPELRSLNASLNAIHSFEGIGVATKLVSVNLSYNNIRVIPEALAECVNLQNLDLSVNKISSLLGFPVLPNLIKLNLRSNKLTSLQGLQALRSIKQINAQKNKITTIVHLCACLEMTELNVADNSLHTVSDIVAAISPLQRLSQIKLKGNPILMTVPIQELQAAIVRETSVVVVDGINIRPVKSQFQSFSHHQPPSPRNEIKIELKEAVKESLKESVRRKHEKIHDHIYFLHKKTLLLLDELEEHENSAITDTEAWCRYIDTLTVEEAKSLTISQIRAAAIVEADGSFPSQISKTGKPLVQQRKSDKDVKRRQAVSSHPDAVLRAAADILRDQKAQN